MKKIGLLFFMVLVAVSCGKKDGYTITVKLDGVEDGKQVFMKKVDENNQPVDVDSTEVKNGEFTFAGKADIPEIHYIIVDQVGNIPVIVENGDIEIEAYKDSINFSKMGGTPSNDDFYAFINGTRSIGEKINALREQMMKASQEKDTVTIATLQDTYADIMDEAKEYEVQFVTDNPDSYISAIVLEKILQSKSQSPEKVKELFSTLTEEVKKTKPAQRITTQLEQASKLSIGAVAPDFSGPTPEGETLTLKDIKGKVTIIDFWAAWCKPCRAENPHVVSLYNKYKDQGLSIIGVSLDRKKEDWEKAIEEDQLPWHHISNLKFWQDPIAQLYNIKAIPATFILDEEGKIVAKNLRGEDLDAKLAELFEM
ncbi:TlpA disulfide reductase family protein [Sinomicrobium weinanense]|uniref:Redoxin domain-containing protein n=1 Tax=Sinomicrobium weinanense TaxID=2842200 RepID=A0A926Q5L7_9FLAO|nr:TlpA disulfide reductase family protein [Sinomicrobium weinanense]MBC9798115.1 redoxin domain-containing protein [Sinomicrobium weinanense]MBU3122991.1 AhpC/TSA family protein [Sinomicrobium weinanense]